MSERPLGGGTVHTLDDRRIVDSVRVATVALETAMDDADPFDNVAIELTVMDDDVAYGDP